jgi:hypothetical protein
MVLLVKAEMAKQTMDHYPKQTRWWIEKEDKSRNEKKTTFFKGNLAMDRGPYEVKNARRDIQKP